MSGLVYVHLSLLGHALFLATVAGSKNGHIQSINANNNSINNSMLNKALSTIIVNCIM